MMASSFPCAALPVSGARMLAIMPILEVGE